MFSNKKNIQKIESELLNNDLTINKRDFLADKFEECKTEVSPASNEGDSNSIYEFTFDPNEETPPPSKQVAQRKKAKPKPKVIFVNNNYETNVLKTLQTLKNSIKRHSLEANNKENVCNDNPETEQQNDERILVELKHTSPCDNKNKLKKVSPIRESLLKDISLDNTPIATAIKHPKPTPWRAELEDIPSARYNDSNIKETSKHSTKTKKAFQSHDTNPTVIENTEPKLKQPRLIDFIKQSSERSKKLQNYSKDRNLNDAEEMVLDHQKMPDHNEKNQETDGSVNLFEELEVIPSVKACRRSYGKKEISSPSFTDKAHGSDKKFLDFSEELSAINTSNKKAELKHAKKKEQKTQLTRQEEEEVNAWAEAFNSMCEDVDDFPLVVE